MITATFITGFTLIIVNNLKKVMAVDASNCHGAVLDMLQSYFYAFQLSNNGEQPRRIDCPISPSLSLIYPSNLKMQDSE